MKWIQLLNFILSFANQEGLNTEVPNMSTNAFGGLWNWSELHFNWTHNYLTALFCPPNFTKQVVFEILYELRWLRDIYHVLSRFILNKNDLSANWLHYDIETTYYPVFISSDLIMTITNCVGIAKEWLAIKSLLVTVPNYKHKNYWHT